MAVIWRRRLKVATIWTAWTIAQWLRLWLHRPALSMTISLPITPMTTSRLLVQQQRRRLPWSCGRGNDLLIAPPHKVSRINFPIDLVSDEAHLAVCEYLVTFADCMRQMWSRSTARRWSTLCRCLPSLRGSAGRTQTSPARRSTTELLHRLQPSRQAPQFKVQ